jgi:hypothetical protein
VAGPSIAVKVLADVKSLGDSFGTAASAGSTAAGKIGSAFNGVLGVLNRTGVLGPFGDAIAGIGEAFDQITQHGKDVGAAMIGVGGAIAGVGLGLQALGSKDQAAHQQLQASVQATGADYDDYAEKVDNAVKHQEKFGDTSAETQNALQKLVQATHDPQKAFDLLSTATDVAAAKHEDLVTAASQVGKVYNGNTKLLKEYGISIDKTTGLTKDGKTATEALAQVTAGQATAAADTFMGRLNGIKASLEDSAASFGQKYGPAITAAGSVMAAFGATIDIVTAAKGALTAADWASVPAQLAAYAPILLIIAAIAVLGAAIYELVTHWSTVWGAMKDAAEAVWNWIKNNWPLLLDILLGPIGLAIGWIVQHWSDVTGAFKAAWNWLAQNWPTLVAILTGPIGVAVLLIKNNWNDLVGFFTGLPGRITSAVSGMWNGILSGFRTVLNGVIDLWNQLHFTLPHIDLGPLGSIAGGTIGVPHVPHLAQGGLMTSSGLVFAHAGEVISPAPRGAAGPAIGTINVTLGDGADVDLLLRKVAFATMAGRL